MIDSRGRTPRRGRRSDELAGVQHIHDAAAELLEGDGDERDRLQRAVACLEAGLRDYALWPTTLREKADAHRSQLTRRGCFESVVSRMRNEAVREVSNQLWQFCQLVLAFQADFEMDRDKQAETSLVEGIDLLREARVLLDGDQLDRRKLRIAAHRFWSAEFHCENWPWELRRMAEDLTAQIFRHGPIDEAFRRMSDEAAQQIRQNLIKLCDDAERACRS
jgi:hypothetical protein